jgi:hypothetical protein
MSDRELLEKAAKAVGKPIEFDDWSGKPVAFLLNDDLVPAWNPLDDNGDTFWLQVALGIEIAFNETSVIVWFGRDQHLTEMKGADPLAATRRAVVRAAAAMAPQETFLPGAEGCFQDPEGTIPVTAIGQPVGRISSSLPEKLERLFQDSAMPVGQRVGFVQHRAENMPTLATKPKEER